MPAPAFWKGYLKLSLVTCAVAMTPATSESSKVRFHTINRKTGRRVRARYIDSQTGKPIAEGDDIRGYETAEGKFVTFDDEELEAVALESVRTIDIETFVAADSIPWIWLDKPYYVTPTDKVGEEAFAVIREAMRDRQMVGISRLVLFRREHAVMLEPRDNGIVLWTLRYGDEVRDDADYLGDIDKAKPAARLMTLVGKLIEERARDWDPSLVRDPVQANLKKIIAAKKRKTRPKPMDKADTKAGTSGAGPSNVVNLMDALKKSLEKPKSSKSRS